MDGMTIDEVIKYFDEDAEENAKLATIYTGNDDDLAEMHKQDANRSSYVSMWLRELKEYRKNYTCFNCYNSSASFSDYPCCECRRCFKALDGIKDHYEEVNADE